MLFKLIITANSLFKTVLNIETPCFVKTRGKLPPRYCLEGIAKCDTLSFASVKYFITMWKFKNRNKDGSEDDDFKRFD